MSLLHLRQRIRRQVNSRITITNLRPNLHNLRHINRTTLRQRHHTTTPLTISIRSQHNTSTPSRRILQPTSPPTSQISRTPSTLKNIRSLGMQRRINTNIITKGHRTVSQTHKSLTVTRRTSHRTRTIISNTRTLTRRTRFLKKLHNIRPTRRLPNRTHTISKLLTRILRRNHTHNHRKLLPNSQHQHLKQPNALLNRLITMSHNTMMRHLQTTNTTSHPSRTPTITITLSHRSMITNSRTLIRSNRPQEVIQRPRNNTIKSPPNLRLSTNLSLPSLNLLSQRRQRFRSLPLMPNHPRPSHNRRRNRRMRLNLLRQQVRYLANHHST